MKQFEYVDLKEKKISADINTIFPEWKGFDERLCVLSPHDDDAIIGAGYVISAALDNQADVFVFIFCSGNAGYSDASQKDRIEDIRKGETVQAYEKLGVKRENIIRFGYSDFSVVQNIGWQLNNNTEGSFKDVVTALRKLKITRLLVPNHYREHLDHAAVSGIGTFYSPQAGDPILVDWGEPHKIDSVLEYSVWADLSPEDSIVNGRSPSLRANKIIAVSEEVEDKIREGISQYKSQGEIIRGLVDSRAERSIGSGKYIEVYLAYDPRPKLDYGPYKELTKNLLGGL